MDVKEYLVRLMANWSDRNQDEERICSQSHDSEPEEDFAKEWACGQ